VGLHFLALAPILRMRFDYVIGTLLCLLSIATMLLLPAYVSVSNTSVEKVFLWGAVAASVLRSCFGQEQSLVL